MTRRIPDIVKPPLQVAPSVSIFALRTQKEAATYCNKNQSAVPNQKADEFKSDMPTATAEQAASPPTGAALRGGYSISRRRPNLDTAEKAVGRNNE